MRRQTWMEVDEHEIGRPHFRHKNPVYTGPSYDGAGAIDLEVLEWPLYDFYNIAVNTAAVAISLFTISQQQSYTPTGGAAFQKQALHTNLQGQGAVLPNPQRHMVKGLFAVLRPDVLPVDYLRFYYQTQVTFTVGDSNKPYHVGLLARIPAAGGPFAIGTPAANLTYITHGWPSISNFYPILADSSDPGVVISQGQNFQVILDPTQQVGGAMTTTAAGGGGTGISLWFHLAGALARSVQ